MRTILERFPILGLFAALGLTTAQLQGRQLATNPQTVMGVTLYSTADITPPATGGNSYTYANENQRISLQQNGNTLTITYKSYGFNHDYSYNGTDSSHRVAAHAWALFEKHSTSMYHNPYWIELSANFWEGSIGSGYPRSNSINIYKWTAANPTPEDIQAVNASAWAEYNELLAQEQDMAFNQDHVNPADFLVDFRIREGIAIGHRCLWMDTKGSFAGTGGGSVAETFTHTIPLTPDMNGKTIVPISWQKSHHTGSKDYDKWGYFIGPEFTLSVVVNPTNDITVDNTGTTTAYNDASVVVSATVTPPNYTNYTYGMRIRKWVGPQNEAPGGGGGQWVEVHSGGMLSGQQTWSGTIQPNLEEVPGKVVYRLVSWQTGAAENANPRDCAIIVPNRAPSSAAITLTRPETGQTAAALEYGQSVNVSGNLVDADGDLRGHSLWVIAPAADGSKNPEWDCISRPLDPDWWGGATSNSGWTGSWANGHASHSTNSTVTGVFTPSRCGVWQLHTNGCDMSYVWGPGDTKDLAVAKATPGGVYAPSVLLQYAGLTSAHLNAAFANPHNGASVSGTISYNLVESGTLGPALEPGATPPLAPGAHTVRASISASDNYNAAHVDATLIVDGNPNGHNNDNDIPNWIEHALGLDPNAPNDANGDLEINIHTPVN